MCMLKIWIVCDVFEIVLDVGFINYFGLVNLLINVYMINY